MEAAWAVLERMRLNRTSVGLKPPTADQTAPPQSPGLNRTSVGLKQRPSGRRGGAGGRLNRTSVGLKQNPEELLLMARFRLNRTSVGLKRCLRRAQMKVIGLPQSNQRGIETVVQGVVCLDHDGASIEPAWD